MDNSLENIGKRIAESRRSAGFTQEELAQAVSKRFERKDSIWINLA